METVMTTVDKTSKQLVVPTDAQMYAAVAGRDAAWDGRFYYGVITTGVYCRPSCSARLAKRDNQRYFDTQAMAEEAGFRPCKRCRPSLLQQENKRLVDLAEYIRQHADERLTLKLLAERVGLSVSRLQKSFKAAFGVSPRAYQDAIRFGSFKGALRAGDDVTGAAFSAGYGSTSRIYGQAARNLGMTPAAYRAGGQHEVLHYACRDSALGPLMMAATEQGVCFAQFGDDKDSLLQQLAAEFPNALLKESLQKDGRELDAWIDALDRHLEGNAPRPDLPLDLRGTAFQLQVWRFLLSTQAGDVVSYGEVATGIGKPRAVRAAASACGKNRVGVLVPCHRVLRGNGELGGYRWGTERKRTLLDVERRSRVGSS